MKKRFDIVLACDKNKGIGKDADLPWKLSKDMKFFRDLTTKGAYKEETLDTVPGAMSNAVIMGRVTWESIPERFRPLKGRVNVVLTRDDQYRDPNAIIKSSLNEALEYLYSNSKIHNIYVIGGASIYKEAFDRDDLRSLFVTEIDKEFDCDRFIQDYEKIKGAKKVWSSDVVEEKGVDYQFVRYNFNNQVSLEEMLVIEKRVALEIYEHHAFGSMFGDPYVAHTESDKFIPCPKYMRNLYKALEVTRHLYAKHKEHIKITKLDLEPLKKRSIPKYVSDEEKFKYTFSVELESGKTYSTSHTHACYAICSLCLKINDLFRRIK